jgi:hypothetical protein
MRKFGQGTIPFSRGGSVWLHQSSWLKAIATDAVRGVPGSQSWDRGCRHPCLPLGNVEFTGRNGRLHNNVQRRLSIARVAEVLIGTDRSNSGCNSASSMNTSKISENDE